MSLLCISRGSKVPRLVHERDAHRTCAASSPLITSISTLDAIARHIVQVKRAYKGVVDAEKVNNGFAIDPCKHDQMQQWDDRNNILAYRIGLRNASHRSHSVLAAQTVILVFDVMATGCFVWNFGPATLTWSLDGHLTDRVCSKGESVKRVSRVNHITGTHSAYEDTQTPIGMQRNRSVSPALPYPTSEVQGRLPLTYGSCVPMLVTPASVFPSLSVIRKDNRFPCEVRMMHHFNASPEP
ncbi:uncharacterized protein BT62DRAFT_1011087 [Guyanagaster necrorhizus]|uniref:Uncharacterized protein n=1 Tax=Guyanagaster necrorhizus TaxID=856835 RepID=A0A9P7VKX3_9AGAR|nr:uncharacterized protein BT62DRAFT_1011087 [Guyanagaster necrorhizus MCA 3950]KAG7441794.1 hypothetical protein BT62DRAFT_1011087 [Guyanagaster necrorhizus MCA 3950]